MAAKKTSENVAEQGRVYDGRVRRYETVVIFHPTLGEAQVKEEIARFQKVVEDGGGQQFSSEIMGKRELAYAMKKQKFGCYVTFTFNAPSEGVLETLSGLMRIADSVLKFQSHRLSDPSRKIKLNPRSKAGDYGNDEFNDGSDSFY